MRRACARLTTLDFTEFTLSHLPRAPQRVLEVGCGSEGGVAPALAAAGYDVVAIDPDAPAGPLYRRVALEDFDDSGPFGAVVAGRVLHHVEPLEPALDKLVRLGVVLDQIVDEFELDALALAGGPRLELLEALGRQAELAGGVAQRHPQQALALDADGERLELHHWAQRRTAEEVPAGLQAPGLLRDPSGQDLDLVFHDAQRGHDLAQGLAVLVDLGRELGQEIAQRGAAVLAGRAVDELEPDGRAAEMVVQVDREVLRGG